VDRLAIPAEVMATCLATAPKARSVTTVVKSDIFPATARVNRTESAINANSLDMSWLNAQTTTRRRLKLATTGVPISV